MSEKKSEIKEIEAHSMDFAEKTAADLLNKKATKFGFTIVHHPRTVYSETYPRFGIMMPGCTIPELFLKSVGDLQCFMAGVEHQARIMRAKLFPGLE